MRRALARLGSETPAVYGRDAAALAGLSAARGRGVEVCGEEIVPAASRADLRIHSCYRRKGPLGPAITESAHVLDLFERVYPAVFEDNHESFFVVLLNAKNRVLGVHLATHGGCSTCSVLPREVFGAAVALSAVAVLVVHNHPSGDPTPSTDDLALTARLKQAGQVLGIRLLDHIILAADPETRSHVYHSCADAGQMPVL